MQTFLRMIAATAVVTAPMGALASPLEAPLHHDLPEAAFFDTLTIQEFLDAEIAGGSYTNALAKAYQERSAYEASYGTAGDGNWYDATAFYNKGLLALAGNEVAPWTPEQLGVTDSAALIAYNATVKRVNKYKSVKPVACAQLTALYDHWLEQVRETPHFITEPDAVFVGWVAAYKGCFTPHAIYGFPVNHCENTDDDWRISDEPAANMNQRSFAQAIATELGADEASGLLDLIDAVVLVEGHASTTASMLYNERLGTCRADFVVELMKAAGVNPDRIGKLTKGETELEVPTADSVEEYRNRRVIVDEQ
jgi:hypothetical protein